MDKSKLRKITWLSAIVLGIAVAAAVFTALGMQFGIHVSNEWQRYVPLPAMRAPRSGDSIVVFAPHADDETLGCGGMLATAEANGAKVSVVLVTNGDGFRIAAARAYKTIRVTPRDCVRFAYKRQGETLRALQTLGVPARCVTFLGYPDRGIARLWDTNWSADELYTSKATGSSHSPYNNSLRFHTPYCGESLLSDIAAVIKRDKPTDIYVPHPCDNHADHYATYCFVTAALGQLEAEHRAFARAIRVHTYLVHRGDWPLPKGDRPRDPLAPPRALAKGDTHWRSLELPDDIVARKRSAIQSYKTQTAIERGFLTSFARRNEIFGDLQSRKVTCVRPNTITTDGEPEDWFGIAPALINPVGDYVVATMNKGGDVRAIYLCSDDRYLYVRLDCVKRLSKRITYTINLRGISESDTDDRYTVSIKPKAAVTPPSTVWAYKNNIIEIAVPMRKLSFDEDLFIQVYTKMMRITVDQTGWHGFEFSRK